MAGQNPATRPAMATAQSQLSRGVSISWQDFTTKVRGVAAGHCCDNRPSHLIHEVDNGSRGSWLKDDSIHFPPNTLRRLFGDRARQFPTLPVFAAEKLVGFR
jgi:hypothetical protein